MQILKSCQYPLLVTPTTEKKNCFWDNYSYLLGFLHLSNHDFDCFIYCKKDTGFTKLLRVLLFQRPQSDGMLFFMSWCNLLPHEWHTPLPYKLFVWKKIIFFLKIEDSYTAKNKSTVTKSSCLIFTAKVPRSIAHLDYCLALYIPVQTENFASSWRETSFVVCADGLCSHQVPCHT